MICEVEGCEEEVFELSGPTGQKLCRTHKYQGKPNRPKAVPGAPEDKMFRPVADKVLELPGVAWEIGEALVAAGYDSREKIAAASDKDLLRVSGIGERRLKKIREALHE